MVEKKGLFSEVTAALTLVTEGFKILSGRKPYNLKDESEMSDVPKCT